MKINTLAATALSLFLASTAYAGHSYIQYDDDGNMVLSGPFSLVIPKPPKARLGPIKHSSPSFMDEKLKVSKAGYFGDDQFVMVEVETTNAGQGTMSNKHLPVYELAGREYRARTACLDISQDELDNDEDPLFEYIETQNVQIVPAVQAIQLFATNDEGTAQGTILFLRNYPAGCDAMTEEFEAEFMAAFEGFIESIRNAN